LATLYRSLADREQDTARGIMVLLECTPLTAEKERDCVRSRPLHSWRGCGQPRCLRPREPSRRSRGL